MADYATNLSELQANPQVVLNQAQDGAVVILAENKPAAYLLPADLYESLMEKLDDQFLAELIRQREMEKSQAVEVSLDAL
jgi:antitoxin StbD